MVEVQKITKLTGHKGSIFSLAKRGDQHFISSGGEGWVVSWDLNNPDPGRLVAKVDSNLFSVYIDGETIIAGDMNGGIHWVDIQNNSSIDLALHRNGVFGIFRLGDWIYSLGGSGYLSRSHIQNPRSQESLQLSHMSLRSIQMISDDTAAIGASNGNIYFVNLNEMSMINMIENAHDNSVFALGLDNKTKMLWSGGRDAQINIWNLEGDLINSIPAHMYTVNSLAYLSNHGLMVSGSRDKSIKIWDTTNFRLIKVIEGMRDGGHLNSVNCLLWTGYKDYLISGSDDKSICIWRISKSKS
ncbi:MAG: hypothetical protein KJP00_05435 [Bacteroidia bacterium]|nr:hypothetical protein [Bacteroidia bacterium]